MKLLFLDESGDHNLIKIDPQYPVFVLSGVVIDAAYNAEIVEPSLLQFRRAWFGDNAPQLHTADITRHRQGFEKLEKESFRNDFFDALNRLIASLDFQILAIAIDKQTFSPHFKETDAYRVALAPMIDSFCNMIPPQRGGLIIAEKRSKKLDRQLLDAWQHLATKPSIRHSIVDLLLRDKQDAYAGLQLADLVATPIGRSIMRKPAKKDWHVIEQKMGATSITLLSSKEEGRGPLRSPALLNTL